MTLGCEGRGWPLSLGSPLASPGPPSANDPQEMVPRPGPLAVLVVLGVSWVLAALASLAAAASHNVVVVVREGDFRRPAPRTANPAPTATRKSITESQTQSSDLQRHSSSSAFRLGSNDTEFRHGSGSATEVKQGAHQRNATNRNINRASLSSPDDHDALSAAKAHPIEASSTIFKMSDEESVRSSSRSETTSRFSKGLAQDHSQSGGNDAAKSKEQDKLLQNPSSHKAQNSRSEKVVKSKLWEKLQSEKTALEKIQPEKPPPLSEKVLSEKLSSEKTPFEKALLEKIQSPKALSEKSTLDKAPVEKSTSEKSPPEKSTSDKLPSGKSPSENSTSEKPSPEKSTSEKATPEKSTSEKTPSGKTALQKLSEEHKIESEFDQERIALASSKNKSSRANEKGAKPKESSENDPESMDFGALVMLLSIARNLPPGLDFNNSFLNSVSSHPHAVSRSARQVGQSMVTKLILGAHAAEGSQPPLMSQPPAGRLLDVWDLAGLSLLATQGDMKNMNQLPNPAAQAVLRTILSMGPASAADEQLVTNRLNNNQLVEVLSNLTAGMDPARKDAPLNSTANLVDFVLSLNGVQVPRSASPALRAGVATLLLTLYECQGDADRHTASKAKMDMVNQLLALRFRSALPPFGAERVTNFDLLTRVLEKIPELLPLTVTDALSGVAPNSPNPPAVHNRNMRDWHVMDQCLELVLRLAGFVQPNLRTYQYYFPSANKRSTPAP